MMLWMIPDMPFHRKSPNPVAQIRLRQAATLQQIGAGLAVYRVPAEPWCVQRAFGQARGCFRRTRENPAEAGLSNLVFFGRRFDFSLRTLGALAVPVGFKDLILDGLLEGLDVTIDVVPSQFSAEPSVDSFHVVHDGNRKVRFGFDDARSSGAPLRPFRGQAESRWNERRQAFASLRLDLDRLVQWENVECRGGELKDKQRSDRVFFSYSEATGLIRSATLSPVIPSSQGERTIAAQERLAAGHRPRR